MRSVKLRSDISKIIIAIVVIYFVYRAISVWLPNIYSAIELYSYEKLNPIWYILLAASLLFTIIFTICKTFGTNGFTSFLKGMFKLLAYATSMIFCVWLIFNVAGLGNTHYLTKAVVNSEYINKEDINEESNGEWVLKVQDFIKAKKQEKSNKERYKDNNGIIAKTSDFIKSEYDAAPQFIQMILSFFEIILNAIYVIIVFILITILWFTVDMSPLILVPISGLLLVLLVDVITQACLSPIKEKLLTRQMLINNTSKKVDINSLLATAEEMHTVNTGSVSGVDIVVHPINSNEVLQAQLNHMANPDVYPDPFE